MSLAPPPKFGPPATKVRWKPRTYKPPVQYTLDPGRYAHVKKSVLRCSLCDYCLEVAHMGPHDVSAKYCPNCWQLKGLKVRLFPSLR